MSLIKRRLLTLGGLLAVAGVAAYVASHEQKASLEQEKAKKAEKKLLELADVEAARELRLSTPSASFALIARQSGKQKSWELTTPLAAAADEATVEGILRSLAELGQKSAVGEKRADGGTKPPEDLALFGLDPPRFRVTVIDANGREQELLIGKKNSFDGTLYVKRADAPDVFLVEGSLNYQVDKSLYDLREKRLAVFGHEDVSQLRVELPLKKAGYTIERKDNRFVLTSPIAATADEMQVTGIFSALGSLRAKSFVSEKPSAKELAGFGLDKPAAKIELTFKQAPTGATVLLGVVGKEDAAKYYAMAAQAGPVAELSGDWAWKKVDVTAETLRDKHVLVFDRDAVTQITLAKGDSVLVFARGSDKDKHRDRWTMTKPESVNVQDSKLVGLLYKLWNLRANRIVREEATSAELEAVGLGDKPALSKAGGPSARVTLTGKDEAQIGTLLFGQIQGDEQYVTSSGSQRLDLVEKSAVDDLSFDPADYKE